MPRLLYGLALALLLSTGGRTMAQGAPAESPARSTSTRLPRLAVVVAIKDASGQDRQNMEDLLAIELASQPFLELVDRQALDTVMKEHAIALATQADPRDAIRLGKFAGADYLLYVLVVQEKPPRTQRTASVRLLEVATGQVKIDQQVALSKDLALSMAAVREKILAALRPDSQAANRLTVGIAQFPNRSGTGRSDKLGLELQKALRKRLSREPWAVVLEREYPTVLLNELELARAGLVRDAAAETLPPADLVISGSLDDANRIYEPDKPWDVKLDLIVRLRGQTTQLNQTLRSDSADAAAENIVQRINQFRREPTSHAAAPEKELWRRQALYLMPKPCESWGKGLAPNLPPLSELNRMELIRAWENVLLLDANNAEAMTCLGVCLIGFDRWFYNVSGVSGTRRTATIARWIAASHMVERALRLEPTPDRATTYCLCIQPLLDVAPERAREMSQFTFDHAELFKSVREFPWIKVALTRPIKPSGENFARLEAALAKADQDPNTILILFPPGLTRNGPVAQYKAILTPHLDSANPVARFAAQRAMGELLCWASKQTAALDHFDQAIAVLDAASQRCDASHRDNLDNIYRLRIEAAQFLGRSDEAKKTALAGAQHFIKIGHFAEFDNPAAWLYEYCVTQALGPGEEQRALEICNAYVAGARKHWQRYPGWPNLSAKREELLARLSGKPLPRMDNLCLIQDEAELLGQEYDGLTGMRMAAAAGKLWFIPLCPYGNKYCMSYDPARDEVSRVSNLPNSATCVAATTDRVFFGGYHGLLKLDTRGHLMKLYDRNGDSFPASALLDLCEGGGKIYFAFQGSAQTGIAVLDPATDKITVLVPSSHDAPAEQEPTDSVQRLQWNAAVGRLYAGYYLQYANSRPFLTDQFGWSPQEKVWQRYPLQEAPLWVISQADETVLFRVVNDQSEFHFVKANQTVTAAVPVPTMIGEPAWDDQRIWVPTSSGLYEVARATGQLKWLAYENNNRFLSALKAGGNLYVATSRGLYLLGKPPTGKPSRAVMAEAVAKPPSGTNSTPVSAQHDTATTLLVNLSLEDDSQAEITITLGRDKVLRKTRPGTVQLELSAGPAQKHVFFHCQGYASQWIYLEPDRGTPSGKQRNVRLFRNRYVILKCAFNPTGNRSLEGNEVQTERVAASHWTGPKYFFHDWQIWQKAPDRALFGNTPYLEFHRMGKDFGFAKPAPGTTYESMHQAPESGYHSDNLKAEKGMVLYCRVNGDASEDCLGYGKILVEDITTTPPGDTAVLESP